MIHLAIPVASYLWLALSVCALIVSRQAQGRVSFRYGCDDTLGMIPVSKRPITLSCDKGVVVAHTGGYSSIAFLFPF